MNDPTALGAVLATLTDRAGKPVPGGAARGQLYASAGEIAVLRPRPRDEWMHRVATWLLLGSIVAVIVNLIEWRSVAVLWIAIGAQAVYWITLPARRRSLEPAPISAAELDAARSGGRIAIAVPAADVVSLSAPEPQRTGFRRPARIELSGGALEMFMSPERFEELRAALGR
jgi:hypothetical protein